MKTIFRNISSFILLILLVACAGLSFSQEFESNENAKIIHNDKLQWGDESKIALEFVRKIGDWDGNDDNYKLNSIEDVERDNSGNIYILDIKYRNIKKFDKNGLYLKTLDGSDGGSGELLLPNGIVLDSQSNLYVIDIYGGLIKVLNSEGEEIRRFKTERSLDRVVRFLTPETMITGGFKRIFRDSSRPPDKKDYPVFSVYDLKGRILYSLGNSIFFKMFSDGDVSRYSIDGAAPFAVDGDGNLYITYKYKNRIEKRDFQGSLIFRADRPLLIEESEFRIDNDLVVSPNVVSANIGVDHNNRIWVETYVREIEEGLNLLRIDKKTTIANNTRFEIFDNEGILLGYIPIPMDYYRMRIEGDRIFFIDTDRISVHEYKIVEK